MVTSRRPQRDSFDVTITGAGISVAAPSRLPLGDEIRDLSWRMVVRGAGQDGTRLAREATRRVTEIDGVGLRLEQLLEVISRDVPTRSVVAAYRVTRGDAFNINHLGLVRHGVVRHFTVNVDNLIESARRTTFPDPQVTHLHGDIDYPESIVTTVQGYRTGLPFAVAEDFTAALDVVPRDVA